MICKNCAEFIQTSEETVGQNVLCPSCHTQQTVSRDPVKCTCPECNQEYELESWMEGETFTCQACNKNVMLTGKHELPKPATPVPVVPHFRTVPKTGGSSPAPASAPAFKPTAAAPAFKPTAAAPAFKPTAAAPASAPAFKPTAAAPAFKPTAAAPAFKPTAAAPAFKPSAPKAVPSVPNPSISSVSAAAPRISIPTVHAAESSVPHISIFPAPQVESSTEPPAAEESFTESSVLPEQLSESAEYFSRLTALPHSDDKKPETAFQCFFREHKKQLIRSLLVSGFALLFLIVLFLFYSLFCGFSFDNSDMVAKGIKLVRSGSWEELSYFLDGFSEKERLEIENKLLKNAMGEMQETRLVQIFKVIKPAGHDALLAALNPEGEFIINAMKKANCDLNFVFPDGSTLLERAASKKSHAAFVNLLVAGADPNYPFKNGLVPLFNLLDRPAHFHALLKADDINVYAKDWEGNLLLFKLLAEKKYELLLPLTKKQKSFSMKNKEGYTYLQRLILEKEIPGRYRLMHIVLKYPCGINETGPDGKTALELAVEQGLHKNMDGQRLCELMLHYGAKPFQGFEQKIEKTSFSDSYISIKRTYEEHPAQEKTDKTPVVYISPLQAKVVFPLPGIRFVIFVVLYLASGLVSLRLVRESKSPARDEWRNMAVLFGGFFALLLILFLRFGGSIISGIGKLIDQIVDGIHQDFVHFYTAAGKEYAKISDPEAFRNLIAARAVFDKIIHGRIEEASIVPQGEKYQILFKADSKEKLFKEIDSVSGIRLLKLLKLLAGLKANEQKPQSGVFYITLGSEEKQVMISTIGLGPAGERAVLVLSDKKQLITSFEQLKFTEKDQTRLQEFINGTGLLLVAGPAGNGRRTFVSCLLEKIAGNGGMTIWIGDGSEPPGSKRVSRLKTDPPNGITIGQLLDAVSICSTLAVTVGTDQAVLPRLIQLAESKKVILLFDKPMEEAVALCRMASPVFDQNLKLMIRPWLLKKLCSCAKPQPIPPDLRPAFQRIGSAAPVVLTSAGCPHCISLGYTDQFVLYETDSLQRPAMTIAMLTALKLAETGKIGLADLETIIKGE